MSLRDEQMNAVACPGCVAPYESRREFLRQGSLGFGWLAFSGLMSSQAVAATPNTSAAHFTPTAKRVIFLFMDGGVSHVDTFDPKPQLSQLNDNNK